MKKIKITESQYRRLITEEEGSSIHPEILENKTLIKVNMAIRLEKVFRELINDEITRADDSLLSRIFPIDDVIDKVKYITPVPGGVGPITVCMLLNNMIKYI